MVLDVRRLFQFPDPVNETSARLVAAGVVLQAAGFLAFREGWLLAPLVYGFLARVLAGPRFSPLGQIVTRVITPRLRNEHRFVPGPPKRFAQGIGLAFTGGAAAAWALGAPAVGIVLIAALLVAATLEAVFALCLGCIAYRFFWECDDCNDISERLCLAFQAQQAQQAGSAAQPVAPATN